MPAVTPSEVRTRVAEWLAHHEGEMTRAQYAADISTATGWSLDYSRLGRYMREELPVGKAVLAHFNAYAEARGLDPIDLGHREPAKSLEERAVIAAERQADAAWAQVEAITLQTRVLSRLLAHVADPDVVAGLESWAQQTLETQSPRVPVADAG